MLPLPQSLCLFSAICQRNLEVNLLLLKSGLGAEILSHSASIYLGTYKSEENQLLLKVYQVKGPTEHYYSKFKNDNWAMDGYVRQTTFFNIFYTSDKFLHISLLIINLAITILM